MTSSQRPDTLPKGPFVRRLVRPGLLSLLSSLLLSACGTFSIDEDAPSRSIERRVYVNDQAAADSLRPDLVRKGVKFVLQPNRSYQLSLESSARSADKLSLYYFANNVPRLYQTLAATNDGDREIFSVASDLPTAQFFMARLSPPDGADKALAGFRRVTLANASILSSDTLQLRVVFVRTLRTLADANAKTAFSRTLFAEMAKIYSPFGIVLEGSIDIIESGAPPVAFKFDRNYVALPGNRVPNHVHLYLVDSIYAPSNSGLSGEILGFAPREVVDIDNHNESRVVLSARILQGQSAFNGAMSLAITATHEIGHFFGLRHTVSTEHDFLQDKDLSNVEDGFTDTRFCALDDGRLLKKSAKSAAPAWMEDLEAQYCLRTTGDISCSNLNCERSNLMHPTDCGTRDQIRLSAQQITFLKTNLASYKH
jgi:hypothetical protein